jgi:hypothetical protein
VSELEDLRHENAVLKHQIELLNSAWRMTVSARQGIYLHVRTEHFVDMTALARLPSSADYTMSLLEEQALSFSHFIDKRVSIYGARGMTADGYPLAVDFNSLDLRQPPPPPTEVVLRSACGARKYHSVSAFRSRPREINVPIIKRPFGFYEWKDNEPMTLTTMSRTFAYAGYDDDEPDKLRYDEVVP